MAVIKCDQSKATTQHFQEDRACMHVCIVNIGKMCNCFDFVALHCIAFVAIVAQVKELLYVRMTHTKIADHAESNTIAIYTMSYDLDHA